MGTRNIRIRRKDMHQHWDSLPGKVLHVVMEDGTTISGLVTAVATDSITLRDANSTWYNRKKHTHTLARNSIQEIILDLISSY